VPDSPYLGFASPPGEKEVGVRIPRLSWLLRLGLVFGLLLVGASVERAAVAPAARGDVKIIELICQPKWRGFAVGQYGGVGFSVSCQSGRGRVRVEGFTGTTYSARMGVESPSIAADCIFNGDAASAQHACAEVVLSIR
jgi:hypothetical protein